MPYSLPFRTPLSCSSLGYVRTCAVGGCFLPPSSLVVVLKSLRGTWLCTEGIISEKENSIPRGETEQLTVCSQFEMTRPPDRRLPCAAPDVLRLCSAKGPIRVALPKTPTLEHPELPTADPRSCLLLRACGDSSIVGKNGVSLLTLGLLRHPPPAYCLCSSGSVLATTRPLYPSIDEGILETARVLTTRNEIPTGRNDMLGIEVGSHF